MKLFLQENQRMSNWQITAKTIFCEAVEDEVTVIVYKDQKVHCTGFKKYTEPNDITRKLVKEKSRRLQRSIQCEGEGCSRVVAYKATVLSQEAQ
jgi:hypothetical protein